MILYQRNGVLYESGKRLGDAKGELKRLYGKTHMIVFAQDTCEYISAKIKMEVIPYTGSSAIILYDIPVLLKPFFKQLFQNHIDG